MDAGSNVKRGAGSMPPPAPPPRHRGTDDLRKQALGGLLSAMGPSAPTAAPSPPTEAPQGHGPPGLLRRLSSDATPIDPDAWKQFWDERREVDLPDRGGAFNVYIAGSTGPILLLIHGAGYTGLTWSLEAAALKHRCRVVAPDLRGHGRTSAQPDTDYSKEMLAEDVVALWQALFSGPQTEGVVAAGGDPHATLIVGHSMGGAVAVWAAETKQIPSLAGCVVVDVVEGTALAALPHMGSVIAMRPTQFPSAEAAVSWALRSGMSRCKAAARVSIPSQLTRSGARLPAAPAPSTQATLPGTTKSTVVKAPGQSMRGPEAVITEVDEEGEGEDEGHRDEQAAAVEESVQSLSQAGDQGSAQASRPPTTPPAALESQGIVDASSASAGTAAGEPAGGSSSSGDAIPGAATAWVWRTSLAATQPFWEGWYTGLSDAFLALPMPKMLLLAGTDRLDKPLTIGQMQGKFQLVMLPMAGHAIQEDDATATSAALDSFMQRQRIGQPPMVIPRAAPGLRPVLPVVAGPVLQP